MRNKALFNAAASSMLFGVTMVGCSGGASMMAGSRAAVAPGEKQALASAAAAEKALAKRDVATAMTAAETAVAAKPDSAPYRVLLGRAYLADGRFASAETAFGDALSLGNRDARAIVSLSLAKVALGKSDEARTLLSSHMDSVPATDYGLAMAMAGDPQEAIRILTAAAQESEATPKTRQNLAYAYALAGQWREARLMAAQDLDPMAATQRVVGWAQTAEPGAESLRVAALIGTQMRGDDAGMPVHLALAPAAPVQTAQADVAMPEPAPAPMEVAVAEVETVAPPQPVQQPVEQPRKLYAKLTVPILNGSPVPARHAVAMRKAALIVPAGPSANGKWVVQLGAFDSAAIAKDRWQRMARKSPIGRFPVSYSTTNVQGRVYHRLAVGGFGDRMAAYQMCHSIRSQGGACFIRAAAPAKLWAAAAKPKQFASR